MTNLVVKSDFTGDLRINFATGGALSSFEDFVKRWQEILLKQLLGEHLYLVMEDNLQSQIWQDLLKGKEITEGNLRWKFSGLKAMLKEFIWFEYNRNSGLKDEETNIPSVDRLLVFHYNKGVDYYYDCIRYLIYNSNDFPNLVYYEKEKKLNTIKF
jgi:hypothetical protein